MWMMQPVLADLLDISNMQYQAELTGLQNDDSVKTLFSIKDAMAWLRWKNREKREEGRKREREKERKRARKRQGLVVLGSGEENPRVFFGDADQESETRMRKNALRTGRRQAVE
ncbi:hypothetical protein TNCV_2715481 [Trichonephila clavipes]|nr:hypothetical protein TNCV_2715481 [Trichonephila clavipes]